MNGGEGGLKTSTMRDNVGKALRDIESNHQITKQNSTDIRELTDKTNDLQSEVSGLAGQVSILVVDFGKS